MSEIQKAQRRPHLLVLTSTFPRWPDDTEPRFVHDLCARLSKSFRITVLAPHCRGAKSEEQIGDLHIKRYRYGPQAMERLAYDGGIMPRLRHNPLAWLMVPFFLLGQVIAIARCLRTRDVDLVHAHWLLPQALCAWVARGLVRSKVPVVCTVHGSDVLALNAPPFRALQRFLGNRCAKVAAVSGTVADALTGRGVDPSRVAVLPMGVPIPERAGSPRNGGPFRIAFAGRLVEKKGLPTLLAAFVQVLESIPDAQLALAGAGPMAVGYREQAERLGVASRVQFLGSVPQARVLELFSESDVTVVPSEFEGLGLVALESMAAGCPVIASDLPVFRTFMEHGRTGILVPPRDAQALGQALVTLASQGARREAMAVAARAVVAERFSWPVAAARYQDLFSKLTPGA